MQNSEIIWELVDAKRQPFEQALRVGADSPHQTQRLAVGAEQ